MKKLIALIKKNFKLLIRSKFSALIILVGPILIMVLAGLAFSNTNTYSISVATYSPDYNDLTNSFLEDLENQYSISKMESEKSCINGVKQTTQHICIIFPGDFSTGNSNHNQINFYVDYSKINLVWMVIDAISSEISETSSDLSLNLTTNLLNQIENVETQLKGKDALINSLLEKNQQIEGEMSTIKTQLSSMDLSFDSTEFNTAGLSSYSTTLKSFLNDAIDEGEDAVDDIADLIEDLEGDIQNMNLSSSDENDLLDITSDINISLSALAGNLSSIDNSSSNSYSQLNILINSISTNLDSLEGQLGTATSGKSTILTQIDQINDKLSTSRVSLLDLQTTINNIQTGLSSVSLRDATDIVNPTDLKINPVVAEKTHLNYFFPSLLTLVIMFISVLLGSNLVMMEKTSSAHFRNTISPTRNITFLISTYLTCLFIMIFQIFLLLIISMFFFNISITFFSTEFVIIGLLGLLVATSFSFLGMSIGYLFKSRETAIMGSVSAITIFFILSDTIVPIESIPSHLTFLTKFNPFMVSTTLFKQVILFNQNILSLGLNLYLLLGFILLFFGLTLVSLIRFRRLQFVKSLYHKKDQLINKVKQKSKTKK